MYQGGLIIGEVGKEERGKRTGNVARSREAPSGKASRRANEDGWGARRRGSRRSVSSGEPTNPWPISLAASMSLRRRIPWRWERAVCELECASAPTKEELAEGDWVARSRVRRRARGSEGEQAVGELECAGEPVAGEELGFIGKSA